MEVERKTGLGRKKRKFKVFGGRAPAVVKRWEVDCGAGNWGQRCSCSLLWSTTVGMVVHGEEFLSDSPLHQPTFPKAWGKEGNRALSIGEELYGQDGELLLPERQSK